MLTDLQEVLPHLRSNLKKCVDSYSIDTHKVSVSELKWGEAPSVESILQEHPSGILILYLCLSFSLCILFS